MLDSSSIFLIVFFIIIGVVYFAIITTAKENILHDLQKRGATNIDIHHEWLDFDRDTLTFSVEYTNTSGDKRRTSCKIHHLDSEIYWSGSLDLEPKQIEEIRTKMASAINDEFPSSEIVIALAVPDSDDIIAMYKYDKAFKNVVRSKPDGSIQWRAELPTSDADDVYTNIARVDGLLTAYSRSCISVVLDDETGQIVSPKK